MQIAPTYKPVTLNVENRKEVAESRISYGNSSALALRSALMKRQSADESVGGLFFRLSCCALRSNHWVGDDLHNEKTGELYAGNGVIWACGSKLCPSCVAKASNRSRKELELALKNQKLYTGEGYKFITLTIPNPNLSLIKTRKVLDRAWTLLRKRKYFDEKIRGSHKSEEFTVTKNGYHYHFHLLCVARFLSYARFRIEWTECVERAFKEFNLPFKVENKDKLLSVTIEKVSQSKNGLKGAVQEVCKYITKSDSWEKIPEKDLIEIASIKRFWRMNELTGFFRTQRNANAILNYPHPFISYLLMNAVLQQIIETVQKMIAAGENIILDTKQISDGWKIAFDEYSGSSPPDEAEKRERQMNWRNHIEQFGLADYLERLREEIESAQDFRKCALKTKYPFASFHTLDGETF